VAAVAIVGDLRAGAEDGVVVVVVVIVVVVEEEEEEEEEAAAAEEDRPVRSCKLPAVFSRISNN